MAAILSDKSSKRGQPRMAEFAVLAHKILRAVNLIASPIANPLNYSVAERQEGQRVG